MNMWQKFSALNKTAKRLTYSALAVGVYALFGFVLLPMIVQPLIIETLSEQLDRPVTLKSMKINPFSLAVKFNALSVSGKHTEQLFGFDSLIVNFNALGLFKQEIAFDELSIIRPAMKVIKLESAGFNFDDLITKFSGDSGESEPSEKESWPVAVTKFRYVDGAVYFEDRNRAEKFESQLEDVSISLDDFSTRPGDGNLHRIKAQTLRGTTIDWQGEFSLSPLKSKGHFELLGDLMVVSEYFQNQMRVKIDSGNLKLKTDYQFQLSENTSEFVIENMLASISDLDVQRKDNHKVLGWKLLSVDVAELNLFNRKADINAVLTENVSVNIVRDKDTRIGFGDLFVLQNMSAASQSDAADEVSQPWDISIAKIANMNTRVTILDESVMPATTHDLKFALVEILNLKPFTDDVADIVLSLKLNNKGVIDIKGKVKPVLKQIELNMQAHSIALKGYQSYINKTMRADILDGQLGADLDISIDASKTTPELLVKGEVNVSSFNMRDKKLKEKFLSWNKLSIDDFSFEYPLQKFKVADITLDKPYLRLVINDGGNTNIQKLMIDVAADKPPVDKSSVNKLRSDNKKAFQAEIKNIRINDAKMDFSDSSLSPNFKAGIYNLKGNIRGLSSNLQSKASVDLKGKVDKYAPVTIKGDINPLIKDKFTEIEMQFKGIELTTFTPYSGKFAGYKIDKGKLSLDLNYKLSKNILVAENRVILDQLTLGETTDSESATSLPVNFALSLLKDSNGVIDFNLPIRGNINDPDFQYSSLIWGALGNLIVGIVSSPFKALANLAGADDEGLDYIVFSANSAELAVAEKSKLDILAKALLQRPELHLEIRGVTSSLVDHDEMAYLTVRKKLKLKPLSLSVNISADDKDEIVDYYEQLTQLSANDLLPKKHTLTAKQQAQMIFDKSLIVVLNKTEVTQAEYLLLAKRRADIIQQYLIETGKVASANIYLLDSNLHLSNELEDVKNSKLKLPLSLKAK